ncbi:MAG: ACP S-malonyltransferase [Caulobacteraceae bacterium]
MFKLLCLFPGQGSQYVGMGKNLADRFEVAKHTFDEANEVLGFDLKKLCFEGSMEKLTMTENTQPAILTTSIAAFRVFMNEINYIPQLYAGHSLGEITALTCSGAINFADALKIVRQRGRLMQEAISNGEGAMTAVSGVDVDIIREICESCSENGQIAVISNYNSPEQIVISGHTSAIERVEKMLSENDAKITRLKVSAPFHCPLMESVAIKLKEELKKYTFTDLKYNVISNVTGLPYSDKDSIVENLSLQVVKPVQWIKSMEYACQKGINIAIEFGPRFVLKNLIKKNIPDISAYSFDIEEDIAIIREKLSSSAASGLSEKEAKIRFIARSLAIAVCTKNSNWDNEEYKKGVIEPYRKVQKNLEELEKEDKVPDFEHINEAAEMLKSVFKTKKTPIEERIDRFNQLFDETGLHYMFDDFKII